MTKILTPKFNFSLIFFLISLSLYRLNNPPQFQTLIPTPSPPQPPINRKNYIVRFIEYKYAEDHKSYLVQNARKIPYDSCTWEWIDRINPASKFPTDFGVVSIDDDAVDSVIRNFEKLEIVKDVRADSTYHLRNLLKTKTKRFDRVGAFVDGKKRPGKIFTSMSFSDGEDFVAAAMDNNQTIDRKRQLLSHKPQVTSLFGADALWSKGYTGAKVKMAIFDTGIRSDHPHFRNLKERTNWTNENSLKDNIGHGTFVAGVIASENEECLGFAPDTEIYAFRVFTDAQVSYTSWFLDAFNYAIAMKMDVLNLSIGGPDNMDLPFIEKVWELTASNIIMVSAIGNDGPYYGTLNNPADQSDVIGVGGIDYSSNIASFSSRGMSTWEIPNGYGRVKPDVVAYGRDIIGSAIDTGCRKLSGTSVASPVVAGIVCLLSSVIPESERKKILNPASMKQTLVEGAVKIHGHNMYEQGAGRVNLLESYEILRNYKPRATIFPNILDYTDCPYTWPFCKQPLYANAMPVLFNTTILNGMGVIGYFSSPPQWIPSSDSGNLLDIRFTYSDTIWPWTGFLALHLQIKSEGSHFSGVISGKVAVHIYSPPATGETKIRRSTCLLHLKLKVIPTPIRSKRILFDQFHNIKYPPGYVPRDSLSVHNDLLDWHGDHLHTNFHQMFNFLIHEGYFIETLGSPFTCFSAQNYGTLLLIDLEDEYFEEEITKLKNDVILGGLGLIVFGDWYNVDTIKKMRFFDDNTRSWWTPVTGGANIPALNDILGAFGIGFGDRVLNGDFILNHERVRYASGCNIVKFPKNGYLHRFPLFNTAENKPTNNNKGDAAIIGLVEVGKGRISVYGDSNCLDSSHMVTDCFWLLTKMLDFTSKNVKDAVLFSNSVKLKRSFNENEKLVIRRKDFNFSMYSRVVGKELVCGNNSRFDLWGTKGVPRQQGIDLGSGMNLTSDFVIQKGSSGNNLFGFLYADEPLVIFPNQWFVPFVFAVFGILVLISLWRIRLKRGRRKKISGSDR